MTWKRIFAVLLTLLVCSAAWAETETTDAEGRSLSVRTFQFKHKQADAAAAIIKTLVSAEGSIAMQPTANALVITDRPENMTAIAAALAQFDTPPQTFHITIRLVAASRVAPGTTAPRVTDDMKDVAGKLAMLRFNAFESLGLADVQAKEGETGLFDMESGYRADFRLGEYDPMSDSVKVNDLRVSKLAGEQKDQLTQLLKTSLNLKLGQTVILGASRTPQSQKALMLVVAARR